MIRGVEVAMADAPPQPPPVIFCQDSPKRVLVSVIRTTPIKATCGGEPEPPPPLIPTSPGFSDFMVYPWRWGENAHNVTLSPGAAGGAASATLPAAAQHPGLRGRGAPPPAASGGEDEEEASSPDSGHLKVSGAGRGAAGRLTARPEPAAPADSAGGAGPSLKRGVAAGAAAWAGAGDRTRRHCRAPKRGPRGRGRGSAADPGSGRPSDPRRAAGGRGGVLEKAGRRVRSGPGRREAAASRALPLGAGRKGLRGLCFTTVDSRPSPR